jgi:hypothetical protein
MPDWSRRRVQSWAARDPRVSKAYLVLSSVRDLGFTVDAYESWREAKEKGDTESDAYRASILNGYLRDTLPLAYSAGAPVGELAWWWDLLCEGWCRSWELKSSVLEDRHRMVLEEISDSFDVYQGALVTASLGVLFGASQADMHRLADAGPAPGADGLFDVLVGRGVADSVDKGAAWSKPYGALWKVVQARPEDRPKALARFVDGWLPGLVTRWPREPMAAQVTGAGGDYLGWWCFEGAAVAKVLGIDDSGLRDSDVYPVDLADGTDGPVRGRALVLDTGPTIWDDLVKGPGKALRPRPGKKVFRLPPEFLDFKEFGVSIQVAPVVWTVDELTKAQTGREGDESVAYRDLGAGLVEVFGRRAVRAPRVPLTWAEVYDGWGTIDRLVDEVTPAFLDYLARGLVLELFGSCGRGQVFTKSSALAASVVTVLDIVVDPEAVRGPGLVVALPKRGSMYVCGANDPEGIIGLAAIAKVACPGATARTRLVPYAMRVDPDGQLTPIEPPK